MGLKAAFGIHHPVMGTDGRMHCWNDGADLTGQQPSGRQKGSPIICPFCRAKNFPDLRGSGPGFRRRR